MIRYDTIRYDLHLVKLKILPSALHDESAKKKKTYAQDGLRYDAV